MKSLLKEKEVWENERQQLVLQIQKLRDELNIKVDDGGRLQQLTIDLEKLKEITQEKEEKLKILQKQLEAKDKEIESLTLTISMHQSLATVNTPRRETRGSLISPRRPTDFFSSTISSSRRSTIARRYLADVQPSSSTSSIGTSLAGELQEAEIKSTPSEV